MNRAALILACIFGTLVTARITFYAGQMWERRGGFTPVCMADDLDKACAFREAAKAQRESLWLDSLPTAKNWTTLENRIPYTAPGILTDASRVTARTMDGWCEVSVNGGEYKRLAHAPCQ